MIKIQITKLNWHSSIRFSLLLAHETMQVCDEYFTVSQVRVTHITGGSEIRPTAITDNDTNRLVFNVFPTATAVITLLAHLVARILQRHRISFRFSS